MCLTTPHNSETNSLTRPRLTFEVGKEVVGVGYALVVDGYYDVGAGNRRIIIVKREYLDKETFLLALRNIAEANGGMKAVAEKAHLNRESLYRTLSHRGNPEIRTLFSLLHGVGLRLTVTPEHVSA